MIFSIERVASSLAGIGKSINEGSVLVSTAAKVGIPNFLLLLRCAHDEYLRKQCRWKTIHKRTT